MQFISFFILANVLLLLFQFVCALKLESFQYAQMMFGAFFILLYFGVFGSLLTGDHELLNKSALFATLFMIWYYLVKKITNGINSDSNGVIYY
jgi:hypothetical protein